MHTFSSGDIYPYCEQYSTPESEVLYAVNRQTHLQTDLPLMLSGHLQGRVLSMISHMIKPTRILEIGTFTGYSALCLAEGLSDDGMLITIDSNEEWKDRCEDFFQQAGMQHKINMICGKAADVLPTLTGEFDLVFIDADKPNYSLYYDLVFDKVKTGGYILADNVLFHGEVLRGDKAGKNARAMHTYNQKMLNDPRIECVLLPLRDGIMLCRKK
jgi:caffeoyl-CoA O-methyltransferase